MSDSRFDHDTLRLAVGIVSAHISYNEVPAAGLPEVIHAVYAALNGAAPITPAAPQSEPAVPVKESVFPNYIICLEDGKKLQMLKRHLQTSFDMTPEDYRKKWGLPDSYPMVAPNYAARRSSIAKSLGLGRKKEAPPPAEKEPRIQRIPVGLTGKRAARKRKAA